MTLLLSKFNPKMRKSGIFCLKFMHLFAKFCSHASYRVLISNMTIFFSYSSPKIPKEDIFGPKFKGFLFLHQPLQQDKLEDKDFIYDNIILKLQLKKKQILSNLKDVDFKYDNSIIKVQSKNVQIRHFLS